MAITCLSTMEEANTPMTKEEGAAYWAARRVLIEELIRKEEAGE